MSKNVMAIGRIQGGRSTLVVATETGFKGYSRPVVRTEVKIETPAIEEVKVVNNVDVIEFDIPEFMKTNQDRRTPAKKEGIVLQFSKEEKEEKKEVTADDIQEAFEDIMQTLGKKIKRFIKPVAKHIFDVYEEDER